MRSILSLITAAVFTVASITARADAVGEVPPLTPDDTEPGQQCLATTCEQQFAGLPDDSSSDPIRLAQADTQQSGGKSTTVTVEEKTTPAPKPTAKVEKKKAEKKPKSTKVEKKPAPKPTTKVTVRTKKSEPPPVVQVEEVGDDTDDEEPPQEEVVEDGDNSTTVTVEEVGEESPTPQPEKKKVTVKKTPKPAAKPEESKTSKTTKVTVTKKKSEPKAAAKPKKATKKTPKPAVQEEVDEESDEETSETAEWVVKHLNPTLTGRTFGWQTGTSLSFSVDFALNDYFVVRPYLGYVQLHDSKYFNGRSLTIIPGGTLEHSALNLGLGFGLIDTRNFEVLAVYQLGISPRGWEYQDVFLQAGVRMFKGHLTAGLVIGGTLPNERVGVMQGLYPNGGFVFGPYLSGSL